MKGYSGKCRAFRGLDVDTENSANEVAIVTNQTTCYAQDRKEVAETVIFRLVEGNSVRSIY